MPGRSPSACGASRASRWNSADSAKRPLEGKNAKWMCTAGVAGVWTKEVHTCSAVNMGVLSQMKSTRFHMTCGFLAPKGQQGMTSSANLGLDFLPSPAGESLPLGPLYSGLIATWRRRPNFRLGTSSKLEIESFFIDFGLGFESMNVIADRQPIL